MFFRRFEYHVMALGVFCLHGHLWSCIVMNDVWSFMVTYNCDIGNKRSLRKIRKIGSIGNTEREDIVGKIGKTRNIG